MVNRTVKIHSGWSLWLQWVGVTVGAIALAGEFVRRLFPFVFGLNVINVVVTGLAVTSLVGVLQWIVVRRFGVSLRAWILATLAGSVLIIAFAAMASFPLLQNAHGPAAYETLPDGSIREWTHEQIDSGNAGARMAIVDGAAGNLTPAGGVVAVGTLGSGVYVGDFDTMPSIMIIWLLGGAAIGVPQWLVLRRRIKGAGEWISAAILGKVAAGFSTTAALVLMTGLVTSLEVPLLVSITGVGVYSAVQAAITGVVLTCIGGERTRWAARIIGLAIIAFYLTALIQSIIIFIRTEGFTFGAVYSDSVIVLTIIAISGYILSWWRERSGGSLLVLASVAFGIVPYVSAIQHHMPFSILSAFLTWLMLGSVLLVVGILFIISSSSSQDSSKLIQSSAG